MKSDKPKKTRKTLTVLDDSKFRALIEKSSDIIVLVNGRGKVLYASPSIVRFFGRSYDEILGINGLRHVHPADLPRLAQLLADLVLHPQKAVTTECRIRHQNGEWRWIVATATNLLHDKSVNGIVVNFHDITEQKRLVELKDEFISIASHELKTPLTSLKGYIHILLRLYGKREEQLRTTLIKMDNQMNRLTHLINEMLDVSRIQERKIQLKKEEFTIGSFVKEVVEDYATVNAKTNSHKRIC